MAAGRPGALARKLSPFGVVDLRVVWPRNDRTDERRAIGNQKWFYGLEALPHRFRWFNGGIGSGKTIALARLLVRNALENPGVFSLLTAKNMPMLKRVQVPEVLQAVAEIEDACDFPGLMKHNRSDHCFTWVNGHKTWYMGATEYEAYRGMTLQAIFGDEIRTWDDPQKAYRVLRGRIRGRKPCGRYLFAITSSPAGRRGPVLDWLNKCTVELAPGVWSGTGQDSEWLLVKMRTSHNTALPDDYETGYRRDMDPKWASQELDAEFVELSGKVFGDVFSLDAWPKGNIIHHWRFEPGRHEIHVAIDWGLAYPHVLWIAHDPEQRDSYSAPTDVIFAEYCVDEIPYHKVIDLLLATEKDYGQKYRALYPDPSGSEENRDLIRAFPGYSIHRYYKTALRDIRWGIFVMRSRFLNGIGQRRLAITAELARSVHNRSSEGRGIVQGALNYDYARTREGKAKDTYKDDSWYIHGVDGCRYYLTHQHPTRTEGICIV